VRNVKLQCHNAKLTEMQKMLNEGATMLKGAKYEMETEIDK